jgi:hypothetical protein
VAKSKNAALFLLEFMKKEKTSPTAGDAVVKSTKRAYSWGFRSSLFATT